MNCFVKIVNGFAKFSILDIWQDYEDASAHERRGKELELVANFKRQNETKTEKDHNKNQ